MSKTQASKRPDRRDPKREAMWRKILQRQRASGRGVRAFCRREGLAESAFHAWRRTIAQRDEQRQAARGRGVSSKGQRPHLSDQPAFVPVVVREMPAEASAGVLEIGLRGGRVLRLPAGLPASSLASVLAVVEGL